MDFFIVPAEPNFRTPSRLPAGHVLQQRNSRAIGPDGIQSVERGSIPANRLRAENLWQAHETAKDSLGVLLVYQLTKFFEKIARIMGSRGSFRVILHTESRIILVTHPLNSLIV